MIDNVIGSYIITDILACQLIGALFMNAELSKVSTISTVIYESLKSSIINLEYTPGEKISEVKIATTFGVSRAPVRNALQRLQQEGLVQIKPQSGTIIAPLPSIKQAMDICGIRLLLEPYAAERAATVITEEEKIPLYDFQLKTKNFNKLTKEQIIEYHREADELIHPLTWRLSGNEQIVSILSGYRNETKRIQLTTAKYASRIPASLKEMIDVNNALLDSDAQKSREAMYLHINNLMEALSKLLER